MNNNDMTVGKRTILIVDDHPVVRRGLAGMLDSEPDLSVTGEASGLGDALDVMRTYRPDLVMVDLALSDGSGIELIRQIRTVDDHAKILVLSMHDEEIYADRCMRAGARGYVEKDVPPDVLLNAVRRVLDGHVFLSDRMSERLLTRAVQGDNESRPPVATLSNRELEVFELLGRGLTTREIASRLNLSIKTIDTYRENIKVKMAIPNSAALIQRAVHWVVEGS